MAAVARKRGFVVDFNNGPEGRDNGVAVSASLHCWSNQLLVIMKSVGEPNSL